MIDALNADKVQRHMMASYYSLQLDALQAEAKRLGYFFAQADTADYMPPTLADCLARGQLQQLQFIALQKRYFTPITPFVSR